MKLTQLKIAGATLLAVGMATGAVVLAAANASLTTKVVRARPVSGAREARGRRDESNGPGTALIPRAVRGRTLKASKSVPFSVAFSPDGKLLAWGQADGIVKLLDAATAKERASFRVAPRQGQHAAVMSLSFSHDSATPGDGLRRHDNQAARRRLGRGTHHNPAKLLRQHPGVCPSWTDVSLGGHEPSPNPLIKMPAIGE